MALSDRLFRVGTRTSRLARIQTELALSALQASNSEARFQVIGITTRGDRNRRVSIPQLGQAAFTK